MKILLALLCCVSLASAQYGVGCYTSQSCPPPTQCIQRVCQPVQTYRQPQVQVTVAVAPGQPCPLPGQICGGGSQCQVTIPSLPGPNPGLGVCICPGGRAQNGVCVQGGGFGGGQMCNRLGQCVAGAGDYCPTGQCVPNANCIQGICRCCASCIRRGKVCIGY